MKPWRSPKYRAAIKTLPCVVSLTIPSDAAHVKADFVGIGLPKPPDSRCVPLCPNCHQHGKNAQHDHNEMDWWKSHGIDPIKLADELFTLWQADIPNIARPKMYNLVLEAHEAMTSFERPEP